MCSIPSFMSRFSSDIIFLLREGLLTFLVKQICFIVFVCLKSVYFTFLLEGIFLGIEFWVNNFCWEVPCHSLFLCIYWVFFSLAAFMIFLFIFRNLIVVCLSPGFLVLFYFVFSFDVSYAWCLLSFLDLWICSCD